MTEQARPEIFASALISSGPHPAIPPESRIFAPFIGGWDLIVSWFDEGGALLRRLAGEWHFAWILEGRGIQDVWIVPPRPARAAAADLYEYGTSLRFYDPGIGAWQSTWIGPMHRVVRSFTARQVGDRVELETAAGTSPRLRWSFADIATDSFTWRNEAWEGSAWRLLQTFEARRRYP